MTIKVRCEVERYEEDDSLRDRKPVIVESFWNGNERIHITVEGKKVTVLGRHMIAAIENAMRTSR